MDRKKIEDRAFEISSHAAEGLGLKVLDAEFVKESGERYLRIYIEREGGRISIDDCSNLSRMVDEKLDELDFIQEKYVLEVSSSGEKPIRKDSEYDTLSGRWVNVKTYSPINGSSRIEGLLMGTDGEDVLIEVEGDVLKVPKKKISKARLAVPFMEVPKNGSK